MHGMGPTHWFALDHVVENGARCQHESPQQEGHEEAVGAGGGRRLWTEEALVPHL